MMVRRIAIQIGLVLALFTFALPARAGIELITFEQPFRAHHLSGVVVDSTGAPVPGVVIEDCVQTFIQARASGNAEPPVFEKRMILDCHSEPKHVLASTTTDSKGHFKFPHTKMEAMHYLYVNRSGFDPMQITVKLRWFAKGKLRIKLIVAT
jgi:hypothetical protein